MKELFHRILNVIFLFIRTYMRKSHIDNIFHSSHTLCDGKLQKENIAKKNDRNSFLVK